VGSQTDVLANAVILVPDEIAPSVIRVLAGQTLRDREVDQLDYSAAPLWLRVSGFLLRTYRAIRPASVGQRCVWDPSCSRYAELALRNRGFVRGIGAIAGRLARCRPGRGGVDTP